MRPTATLPIDGRFRQLMPYGGCVATDAEPVDPVLERRRRIASLVSLGQRAGYGLFGVAIVLFVIGLVAGFGGAVGTGITVCIVVGSIVLAPAIVFGYAVRAAERDDREHGRPTMGGRSAG